MNRLVELKNLHLSESCILLAIQFPPFHICYGFQKGFRRTTKAKELTDQSHNQAEIPKQMYERIPGGWSNESRDHIKRFRIFLSPSLLPSYVPNIPTKPVPINQLQHSYISLRSIKLPWPNMQVRLPAIASKLLYKNVIFMPYFIVGAEVSERKHQARMTCRASGVSIDINILLGILEITC